MTDNNSHNLAGVELKVLDTSVGLFSNNEDLIGSPEYFGGTPHPAVAAGDGWRIHSQEANLRIEMVQLEPHSPLDGTFSILDKEGAVPRIEIREERITACGHWTALEERTRDRRYSLLGNQGVLFRYLLTVLERKGIFNFHACGLVHRDTGTAYLVLGERGSGKSALLLAALASGQYLSFGTEIVHAGIEDDRLVFYRGCLRNNVRIGHMIYDFPGLIDEIGVSFSEIDDPWRIKVQLDFSSFAVTGDTIVDPSLVLVIPRIEEEVSDPKVREFSLEDRDKLKRPLIENISDKINSLALIYEEIPVGSLDSPKLMKNRKEFVDVMLERGRIAAAVEMFASPRNCLEGLRL